MKMTTEERRIKYSDEVCRELRFQMVEVKK